MKIRLIKKNGNAYIQLPGQFKQLDEIEIFNLRDDFWLISAPLPKPAIEGGKSLSSGEKSVLHKLMKIRFADRTPSKIEKMFSADEKSVVRALIKKGLLQVFYGGNYKKTGVYNISDEIYPLLSGQSINAITAKGAVPEVAKAGVAKTETENRKPETPFAHPFSYSELMKIGWTVISNPRNAEQFSFDLKKSGLSQNVKGVRAFDGKFYVATNRFLYAAYEKIKTVLEKKKEMHVEEIAVACVLEPEAVSTVLHILAETGEVIEKKKGLFCLA